jgi:hypothetical protein
MFNRVKPRVSGMGTEPIQPKQWFFKTNPINNQTEKKKDLHSILRAEGRRVSKLRRSRKSSS